MIWRAKKRHIFSTMLYEITGSFMLAQGQKLKDIRKQREKRGAERTPLQLVMYLPTCYI
jgi:hypothetical protein